MVSYVEDWWSICQVTELGADRRVYRLINPGCTEFTRGFVFTAKRKKATGKKHMLRITETKRNSRRRSLFSFRRSRDEGMDLLACGSGLDLSSG